VATFWQWLDVYELAYDTPGDLSALACPNCGRRTLALIYTGDLGEMTGYGTFWCNHCRQGIGISRAIVPADAVLRDWRLTPVQRQPSIPNDIHLVAPEDPVGAENFIRAGQAACSYSCRTPPKRSCRRMLRRVIVAGSAIDSGSGCNGRALEIPRWGRWVL
jgi:hypothetical protein